MQQKLKERIRFIEDNLIITIGLLLFSVSRTLFKEKDPDAFISMGSIMGVFGHGFDKLKF